MDYRIVDRMIRDLNEGIHPPPSLLFNVELHDWKPLFSLARQIQAEFSGGLRYPTKHEREEAWQTFSAARRLLHERSNREWEAFGRQSTRNRDHILQHVKHARYYKWDIGTPTPDQMRDKERLIKEAVQMLERHWAQMLHEHRQQCKERFSELREEHSEFWRQYKQQQSAALSERISRKEEALSRLNEVLTGRRSKLERKRSNLAANIDRLAQTRNPTKAREITGWIAEGEQEIADILGEIRDIEAKIEGCEAQLRELEGRRR